MAGAPDVPSFIVEAHERRQHQLSSETARIEGSPPRQITYMPIPGPWRRKENPNWPDAAFRIPTHVPFGTIYYVTKGRWIGQGSTAHIELLPSGHVVKYPKSNPYCPKTEEENRHRVRAEADVYKRLNGASCVPKLICWDPGDCCLTLEYMENGNLGTYVGKLCEVASGGRVVNHVPVQTRRRWAVQAARALIVVHAANVIHCDVAPRNFLLNAQLDLCIADFAGCAISGAAALVAPGSRYQPPGWHWKRTAMASDDVFALGSVLYFIMVGTEPYADLEEEKVDHLFQRDKFPNVDQVAYGSIIQGCWEGTLSTAQAVVDALNDVSWETKDMEQFR